VEGDETMPLSEYAASKLMAEVGLAELSDNSFHVYLLRNATAYGSSPVLRTDLVVNDLSAGMCSYNVAEIRSDGSPWRPLIHCLDMARAFQLFIERDPSKLNGTPINVGFNLENFQVRTIGNMVQNVWPGGDLIFSKSSAPDPRDYKVNFSLLEDTFPNFHPKYPLQIGVSDLKSSLIESGYSKNDRDSKRFVRLQEIRYRLSEL
jgi:nucleoside-diphosphate-sugar epimerase